jgi:hypothetical protein
MKTASTSLFLLAAVLIAPMAAYAAGDGGVGDCVRLRDIQDSPVINDKTVLLKMYASHQYKRVDLTPTCSGLIFTGFSHKTPEDRLCKSDTIYVNGGGGATCNIDKIVDIDENEAKALRAKH